MKFSSSLKKLEIINDILKSDSIYKLIRLFSKVKLSDFKKWIIYVKNIIKNVLPNLKPPNDIKLSFWEHVENWLVNINRGLINKVINDLNFEQIVLGAQGTYGPKNKEVKDLVLFRKPLGPTEPYLKSLSFTSKIKLGLLKSVVGKISLEEIKNYLKSLNSRELVLIANGKYNPYKALFKALRSTVFPNNIQKVNEEIKLELT